MQSTISYRGIWIPWSEDNPNRRAAHEQILRTAVHTSGADMASAYRVASRYDHSIVFGLGDDKTSTPVSPRSIPPGSPIFVDSQTATEMAMAVSAVRHGVVAVLAGDMLDLSGWAKAVKATNALTGQTEDPVSPEVHDMLDRIATLGSTDFRDRSNESVRASVPRLTDEIRSAGYTTDFIVSYLYAYGLDPENERKLRKLIAER
ncbi:hypothetical protein [Nocardia sp. NBC_01388]|uniref:hypothetical protein n=1 Tax=Nocardia sp. NBC_01388 TaxID=2903596 RepID=UPI0032517EC5